MRDSNNGKHINFVAGCISMHMCQWFVRNRTNSGPVFLKPSRITNDSDVHYIRDSMMSVMSMMLLMGEMFLMAVVFLMAVRFLIAVMFLMAAMVLMVVMV